MDSQLFRFCSVLFSDFTVLSIVLPITHIFWYRTHHIQIIISTISANDDDAYDLYRLYQVGNEEAVVNHSHMLT